MPSLTQRLFLTTFMAAISAFGAGACATSTPAKTAEAAESAEEPVATAPQRLSSRDVEEARQNAQIVAGTWVLQVDKGDYVGSWDAAASALQNRVGKGEWNQGLTSARAPFGDLQRRHFVKTKYTNKLRPAGHHVVVNYHSLFANSPAKETVTVMKDADDQWRVIMYGIQKTDTPPPEDAPPPQEDANDDTDATP